MEALDWVQVYGGSQVRPLALRKCDIDIGVIAHALSNICRFGGHCSRFYSVGEHSVRCSQLVPQPMALWALLHDASEAYLLDIPKPLKHTEAFLEYRSAERRAMEVICGKFGLPVAEPAIVKIADEKMLATEARDLMQPLHPEWSEWLTVDPLAERITPWHPGEAEAKFLRRFHQLAERIG